MQELKNKEAAVVVFSGGQDSTTCLFWALKRYKKVIALSFDYHQKHVKELECAKKICRDHEVEHHIMDMSLLNQLAPNSLTRVDIKVDENAPEEGTPNSFVDGRNLLFLSYAAVFAKQRGITDIITGVSQSDFSGYPDCRDIFIKSLNTTLRLITSTITYPLFHHYLHQLVCHRAKNSQNAKHQIPPPVLCAIAFQICGLATQCTPAKSGTSLKAYSC